MSRFSVRRRATMRNVFGAMLAAVFTSSSVFAQTNGTWNVQSGNWSAGTNWVGGNIADGGGIATFDNFRGQLSNIAVTVDTTSRTLSQINFNQSFSVSIAGSGGGTILVSPTGLTLNSIASTVSSPATYFNTVNGISAVIAGSGNLVKTGQGNVALSGANTFTGNVVINEGALWLTAGTAAGQDTALGNVANSVQLNGGILGVSTNALTTSRSVVIGPNGGTIRLFAAANLNGSLSGSGLLTSQLGSGALTLGGTTSGFTGGILVDNSTVNLNGTTALGGSADIIVGGTLGLVNTTNNVANRLNGRSIVSYGGNLNFTAGTAGAMNEAAGNLVLASGSTTVSVNPSASTGANVSFTGLTRQDRSTVLFRGTGLGTTGAVANVLFTSAPGTLIGGGGDPNTSTNASILPFAIGSRVGGVTSGANISFVTWDSVTQRITALDVTSGYATNLASAASDDNVNLTANSSVNIGGQTINSLRFGGGIILDGASSDVLTVNSGAILSAPSTGTAVINAPINFGSNEGVVFASGPLTINGVISGTNGLTKSGVGILTLGNNNTYTGVTTLAHGQTRVGGGIVTADGSAPSAFGQDTSAIQVLSTNNTAGAPTRLWTTGNLVINRDINVKLGGQQTTAFGTVGASANESLTINGNLALNVPDSNMLNRFLTLEGGDSLAESVTINGNITGNGGLRAAFGAYNVLAGNNTYSGGTLVGTSTFSGGVGNALNVFTETWDARSSTAFGTGAVYIHSSVNATQPVLGTGLILSNGTSPNTFANDFHLTSGFARFGGTQAMTINGNVFLNSAATNNSVITVESTSAPVRINSAISGGGLIKNGAGTLTLAGNNTFSGQTIVRQGTLSVQTIGNGGSIGNLGQAPSAANYLALSGNSVGDTGTLAYTGGGESTDRLFTLQGAGGTIDSSGTGALQFNNSTGTIGQGFGSVTVNNVTLVANAGVVGLSTTLASQLVVGSTVTGTGIAAGTTITEVGPNFVRLSATGTNVAGTQNLTFTLPASLTNRTLTLTGTNANLNTIAPTLTNGTTINLAVAKTGTGIWQLTGANTYSGGTTISQGTLLANNTSGSAFGTGNVVVGANGTLGGSGTILPGSGNSVTVTGTIAPGNSAGTLNIGSSSGLTTLNIDGVYSFELSQVGLGGVGVDSGLSSATATHDVLNVFGTTNFGALSTVNVTSLGLTGFNSLESYSWRILTTNGGIINGLPTLGIVAGGDFAAFQSNFSLGAANGDLFLNFAAVPEPSTMALLSSVMLVGYLGRRRFKKANPVAGE